LPQKDTDEGGDGIFLGEKSFDSDILNAPSGLGPPPLGREDL